MKKLCLLTLASALVALSLSAQDTLRTYLSTGKTSDYFQVDSVRFTSKYLRVHTHDDGVKVAFANRIDSIKYHKDTKKHVRLLYWNIQNGMWDGQDDNYDRFVAWVKEQKPDICVWCEGQTIYYNGTATAMPASQRFLVAGWSALAARYGHYYTYVGGHRDNYPQVITSKYPITNVQRITGNSDTLVCHGAGHAKIKVAGREINIVTVHPWPQSYGYGVAVADRDRSTAAGEGDKFRRAEMEYICNHTILQHPNAANENWIMAGDFNSISSYDNFKYNYSPSSTAFLVHDYIHDHTPYIDIIHQKAPTVFKPSMGNKGRRIDYVYCTQPLYDYIRKASIWWDDYTTPVKALDDNGNQISNFWHPSDHLPIIVDFAF